MGPIRRTVTLAGLVFLFLAFAACGANQDTLSISKDNQTLYYGMSRESAEKILGEPVQDTNYTYYDACRIFYRDGKLAWISVHEPGWAVDGGIAVNESSRDDLLAVYGDAIRVTQKGSYVEISDEELEQKLADAISLLVMYRMESGKLVPTSNKEYIEKYDRDMERVDAELQKTFIMSFIIQAEEDDLVDLINFGDYTGYYDQK